MMLVRLCVPVFRFALILSAFAWLLSSSEIALICQRHVPRLFQISGFRVCCKLFMASFYLQHLFLLLLSHPTHFTGPHNQPPEASFIAYGVLCRQSARIFKPENSEWILRKSTLPVGNCGYFKIEEKNSAFRRHRASVQSNHEKSIFTRGVEGFWMMRFIFFLTLDPDF